MSKKLLPKTDAQPAIAIYQGADGRSQIQVRLENESVWVTQDGIAELYQTSIRPERFTRSRRTDSPTRRVAPEDACATAM